MVKADGTCKAHSGVVTNMKNYAIVVSILMAIFSALLGVMWSDMRSNQMEMRENQKSLMTEVKCLASKDDVNALTIRQNLIRDEQMGIKARVEYLEKSVK